LNVVFFPGSYAEIVDLLCAKGDLSCQLSTATDNGRHRTIVELESQTVNSDTNARRNLCQDFSLEISGAVNFFFGHFLDFGIREVLAGLSTLSFDQTASGLRPSHRSCQSHLKSGFGQQGLLMLLKLHGSKLSHFFELVRLEGGNLSIQAENSLEHFLSIILLFVTSILQVL